MEYASNSRSFVRSANEKFPSELFKAIMSEVRFFYRKCLMLLALQIYGAGNFGYYTHSKSKSRLTSVADVIDAVKGNIFNMSSWIA